MNQQPGTHELEQATRLYQNGELQLAAKACRDYLFRSPADPHALILLVNIMSRQGRGKEALKYLNKQARKFSNNTDALNAIGVVFKQLGELDKARQIFQSALALDANNAHAAFNLGNIFENSNKLREAKQCYRRAIESNPGFSEPVAALAGLLAKENETAAAQELCHSVLARTPDNAKANFTLAGIYAGNREYKKVVKLLQPLVNNARLAPVNLAVAMEKIAKAQEKLGNYQQAFSAFKQCNDVTYNGVADTLQRGRSVYAPESIGRIQAYFTEHPFSEWASVHPDDGHPAPVFLVGFPRSGTTLLDQILTSHKAVYTLEENENLQDIYNDFALSVSGLMALAKLNETEIRNYRNKYWSRVMQDVPKHKEFDVIIDKLPLNMVMLGHIYRFFPEAKIIFALRDPHDVCLSCYQQNFIVTEAMFPFLKLETTVAYYDQVMKLAQYFMNNLPIASITIRYEDVVADLRKAVTPLIAFLGLEWDEQVLHFQATARKRQIRTPSREQVVQPLYQSSVGKWKAYKEFLEPHWQKLDKWADEFGYKDH